MSTITKAAVKDFTIGSLEDRFTFPQVIETLTALKAESYRVDMMRLTFIIYGLDGGSEEETLTPTISPELKVNSTFNPVLIKTAIHQIFVDNNYVNFLNAIAAAGVAEYHNYFNKDLNRYISRDGQTWTFASTDL
jgi:hypothetical protein